MNGYTPGPWAYEYDNDTGPDDGYFEEWYGMPGVFKAEREEDARLIATAPELLEALCRLADACDTGERDAQGRQRGVSMPDKESVWAARAAIAKATGEQP